MNLDREFAAANARIQAQINASAREALIRIGVDPDEVEREEAARQREALLAPYVAAGAGLRVLVDTISEAFNAILGAFERGYEEGGR